MYWNDFGSYNIENVQSSRSIISFDEMFNVMLDMDIEEDLCWRSSKLCTDRVCSDPWLYFFTSMNGRMGCRFSTN